MNIQSIKTAGLNVANAAKSAGVFAAVSVGRAFKNPAVRKNARKSLPAALACTGGFSLLAFLKNKKRDGKQTKLEKSSGTLAQIAFAAASFKHFFKNTNVEQLGSAFQNLKKFHFREAWNVLKINKSNAIVYAASVIGVKLVTDLTTKLIDTVTKKTGLSPKLGDGNTKLTGGKN